MCGISGIIQLENKTVQFLEKKLTVMNALQAHRGPDDEGVWVHSGNYIGFGHKRLSIIDLSQAAGQPMKDRAGNLIVFNGEIYNYIELRKELGFENFETDSDTEVILLAYRKWGNDCVNHFRGMFAFALWDEKRHRLFCARDRFGIKPFYYAVLDNTIYFASEAKALLPFFQHIETDIEGIKDYLTFQFCLDGKTLFKGIRELPPGHILSVANGRLEINKYWEVYYNLDWDHTSKYFEEKVSELLIDSVNIHLRSDVPLGAYVSGGIDSSTIASLGSSKSGGEFVGFTGKFSYGPEYDESKYARELADLCNFPIHEIEMEASDFIENIRKVIYHLDYPVAGPGSFPQYMVSRLASRYRKVVLGGQGGDEIFGGYTRYLIAYFEQCLKGAIDGTMNLGNFVVTYESIIPNLESLRNYKPLMKKFWADGMFDDIDSRYFRLINRAPDLGDEINWMYLEDYSSFQTFKKIFNSKNVGKKSYFDLMTHFDFKTLLPALLQVEDRVSMAHGLESRVPLLDHALVELAATIPANIKFKNGKMKHLFSNIAKPFLPDSITKRKDKMGFPVPLNDWLKNEVKEFAMDVFLSKKATTRDMIDNSKVFKSLEKEGKFGRKIWGLLSLELWQQEFHDKECDFQKMCGSDDISIDPSVFKYKEN